MLPVVVTRRQENVTITDRDKAPAVLLESDPLPNSFGCRIQVRPLDRQCPGESLRCAGNVLNKLVGVASPARLGDANERRIHLLLCEPPLHGRAATVPIPFNDNSLVGFNRLDAHLSRDVVHFPFPGDLLASLKSAAALGEPEFGRDRRSMKAEKPRQSACG